MSNRFYKATSLGLVALYTFIATFGHALHDHSGSQRAEGNESLAAQSHCCGCKQHCHSDGPQNPANHSDDQGAAFRLARRMHNPHGCAACQAIGYLKIACSLGESHLTHSAHVGESLGIYDSPRVAAFRRTTIARGPPLRLFA